jgi:uncharacterized DUF497 family protein
MRFQYDPAKDRLLRSNPKRAIGFEEAQALFDLPHYTDYLSGYPEQFLAIGWVNATLYTVIYEVRKDEEGEFYWLVTLWKSTSQERNLHAEF